MKLPWLAMAAIFMALSLGLVACGDDDEDGGGGGDAKNANFDLTIGDLVPLTGDLSAFGPPGRKSADLAVDEITSALKEAKVDGVSVKVEHADDETDAEAAVSAARKLLSGGATCLAGDWASSTTIPVGKSVASRRKVPLISPASTSAEITDLEDDGYVFRTAPSDNLQAVALADVIEEKLGSTDGTISLAARNDAYGEGFINKFKEAWEERDGKTTGPVLYDPQASSFNSEASDITKGDPDAIVVIDFPETYAKVGPALVRAGDGFDPSKVFVADGLAVDSLEENKIPAESLDGATGTRPGTPEAGEAAKAFGKLYSGSDKKPKARQTFDAQNFDAVTLCFLGALAAGSADGEAIQAALPDVSGPGGDKYTFEQLPEAIEAIRNGEDIDYEGASGPVDWDDNGDPTTATYEVFSYVDGKIKVDRAFEAKSEGGAEEGGEE